MNNEIYIPPGCFQAKDMPDSQIRLGIQGFPFTGKTYSSLSFPNPIVLSLDRKVAAHAAPDITIVPFYDVKFINSIVPKAGIETPPEVKDALIKWLTKEGIKLKPTQTLILDGSTGIEEAFHVWYRFNEIELASTKTGLIDGFVQWNLKKDFFGELFAAMKAIPANIIYIAHESEKTKDGQSTGKMRPFITGQVGDKIVGNFTDWFRAWVVDKPSDNEQIKKLREWAGVDDITIKDWIASTPSNYKSIHLWQTQGDSQCDCGTSTLQGAPKYILANYGSFNKYKRKVTT